MNISSHIGCTPLGHSAWPTHRDPKFRRRCPTASLPPSPTWRGGPSDLAEGAMGIVALPDFAGFGELPFFFFFFFFFFPRFVFAYIYIYIYIALCSCLVGGLPPKKYFASSNPHTPHSRAYDREHGCLNSSMVFEWLGAYDCSTSFLHSEPYPPVCVSNSTCLRADLENSNIGSVNKSQAPSKKKPDGGLNEVAYSQPKGTQKHHPFRASGCTQNTKSPT